MAGNEDPGWAGPSTGLPDGDLKFKRIVETPDAAYKRVFDIEGCVRYMEECGVDMALIGLGTWTDAGLDVCKKSMTARRS